MDKNYWNNYYAENNQSQEPTSFAKSVVNLISPKSKVMELGCGTGRDSYYFMTKGHIVFACDQSEVIIENLSKNNQSNPYFFKSSINQLIGGEISDGKKQIQDCWFCGYSYGSRACCVCASCYHKRLSSSRHESGA